MQRTEKKERGKIMAATIAELFIKRWVEENLPGAKVEMKGRYASVTDSNGDSIEVLYEPRERRIICVDCNADNILYIP